MGFTTSLIPKGKKGFWHVGYSGYWIGKRKIEVYGRKRDAERRARQLHASGEEMIYVDWQWPGATMVNVASAGYADILDCR